MDNFNENEFEVIKERQGEKNTIIVSDINKQQKKRNFKKAFLTVSCFAAIGFGIGAGLNVSENLVTKYEQASFSFDTKESKEGNKNLLLTSSNSLVDTIKAASNSVVNINTTSTTSIYGGFFSQSYENAGSGSGIIYKVDNDLVYIITNNHVVQDAKTVTVSLTGQEQLPAKLVGKDASSDLAVISVNLQDFKEAGVPEIAPSVFGDSENIEVGEYVFPIGNALGEGKTVTQGIISAQNKEIVIDGKTLTVLQTDAAINPGNSGGALINTSGEVIGINTAKLSSSAVEGIGYAIPSNIAKSIAEDIILNGSIEKPYFGIIGFTLTDQIKATYNLNVDGVFVTEVEKMSSAEKAGLKPTDIIIGFNDKEIKTIDDLSKAISSFKKGDSVEVKIIRNGFQEMSLNAVLTGTNTAF